MQRSPQIQFLTLGWCPARHPALFSGERARARDFAKRACGPEARVACRQAGNGNSPRSQLIPNSTQPPRSADRPAPRPRCRSSSSCSATLLTLCSNKHRSLVIPQPAYDTPLLLQKAGFPSICVLHWLAVPCSSLRRFWVYQALSFHVNGRSPGGTSIPQFHAGQRGLPERPNSSFLPRPAQVRVALPRATSFRVVLASLPTPLFRVSSGCLS